jgi:amidase
LTVEEANEVDALRLAYQKQYMRRMVKEKVDAIICPVQPWVGFRPKTWVQSRQNVSYTSHWNWVDFAALAVPVTVARREDTGSEEWKEWLPRDESDDFNWRQYDPELVTGMPVGVLVVAGRFGEDKCVAVGRVVEEVLAGKR